MHVDLAIVVFVGIIHNHLNVVVPECDPHVSGGQAYLRRHTNRRTRSKDIAPPTQSHAEVVYAA